MPDRHRPRAAVPAVLTLLGLAAAALATEPPAASGSQPAATPPSAAAPAAPPAAKPSKDKATPLHFEPTEKTRADFEVSFPSDI